MKISKTSPFFPIIFSVVFFFSQSIGNAAKNTTKSPKGESQVVTDTNIVAVVNGQKIPKQELYTLLIDTYGEDALDVLIRRTLILQAAEKEGIKITNTEIEQKLETLINNEIEGLLRTYQIKDRADLEKELAKVGSSLENVKKKMSTRMRKQAEVELLAERLMEKTITVTDEDLQKAYDLQYGEKIEASQIVFRTRREAEDALKKLQAGADFATLAKNESVDRISAARGGKMQPFSPKDGIGTDVAHLKVGEISDIIKTDYGYHIIKITDRKPPSNNSFKSVKGELAKAVRNQKYKERVGPWLMSLIENASIVKNLGND
ncbi:MAG: peptidyl-prolyl cis-trans isomerase [Planctomycetia bacterium]|nr:peptidylprolyl isomerase [Candidatus Brocadia sapporoensis]MCC7238013.1 peptidyl-prolyl cis-trans isomerase [Candidatus Brocadia sp.]QOJ07036.1 MAG: peptidyl-prolyl cis-trans isomerase [Planctomycetia bacterium]HQU30743.1 peptidyl-prolyl cis-trans isomerase [Candidatus Brocadia sapporoensis]